MDIAHVIQLAIAPVFLLSSLGTVLSVLTTRLGRIVDRTRTLLERREKGLAEDRLPRLEEEVTMLVRRRALVNLAIGSATLASLLVCLLIAVAFLGSLVALHTGPAVAGLFVLAMVAYIGALVLFFREVLMSAGNTYVDFH